MRLLVCGGRKFGLDLPEMTAAELELAALERVALFAELDRLHRLRPIGTLIHGAATGADSLAGAWAGRRGVPVAAFPVPAEEWAFYGGRAGHRRNQRMLDEGQPGVVLATPGGRGTRDMVRRALDAGVVVLRLIAPAIVTCR